jgi:hypothetical protein
MDALTAIVQGPELDGWKNDSVLVINRSSESSALEPPAKPVVGGCSASSFPGVDACESDRTGPSAEME